MPEKIENIFKNEKCKTLYYPGAYYDFTTLKYFLENSLIQDFYYCDYMNYELNEINIINELNEQLSSNSYQVILRDTLTPEHFKQKDWESFWHRNLDARSVGAIDKSFIYHYEIKSEENSWNLYYFGTEAIKTYTILIRNEIKMDVVVTQDHGLGCLWTTFCRGSYLEKSSVLNNSIPKFLLVGEDGEAWNGYERYTEPFGNFGMHIHSRILYKKVTNSNKLNH